MQIVDVEDDSQRSSPISPILMKKTLLTQRREFKTPKKEYASSMAMLNKGPSKVIHFQHYDSDHSW